MNVPLDRVGLHQAADVDVALRDDAVERRHDLLIDLLLVEHAELRLAAPLTLACGDADRRLLRLEGLTSMVPCCWVTQPLSTSGLSRSQVTWASSRFACVCCSVAWSWASVASAWAI